MVIYTNEVTMFSSDSPKYWYIHGKRPPTINDFNLKAAEGNEAEQSLPQLLLKTLSKYQKVPLSKMHL